MWRLTHAVIQKISTNRVAGYCRYEDTIKICFALGGEARFAIARETFTAGTGLVFVGGNGAAWNWEVGSTSQLMALIPPAGEARFPRRRQAILAERDAPAARLLFAQLRLLAGLRDRLTPVVARAARDATLDLFHGLLDDVVVDDEQSSPALVRAAMDWIDAQLLEDPDLSPATVAASLHVSVRTLHRAFAGEAVSVMGYIREQRLRHARTELTTTSLSASEIAARWHFTDISHFSRLF